jgi:tetratricopeptide (TPR) repeat protein
VRFRPPGRRTSWRYDWLAFVLAGLTAAVTAGLQVSGKLEATPTWVFLALYGVALVLVVAAGLVKLLSASAVEDRKWANQVQQLLSVPPTEDGRLRRLSTLSPYRLGVSPSRYGSEDQSGADPYVSRGDGDRGADRELDRALQRRGAFVLVVGDSKAGKSRTAYEAARRLSVNGRRHDPKVLVPQGTVAIGPLLDLDPPFELAPAPALLWLDDPTEGELGALALEVLDRLRQEPVLILGTITAQRYGRIEASDNEIGRSARQALARATVVRLDSQLTDRERDAAKAAYPQETFAAGIGEQLVAAEKLAARYDNARQGQDVHGWAVVQAAIDWVRMDVGRPVRRSELASLYPLYLRMVRPTEEPHSDLTEPLKWAHDPVGSRIALLQPVTDGTGETSELPFDYLVALADGQHDRAPQPIPDPTWEQLPHLTTATECHRAAVTAYYRGLFPTARTLLAFISSSDDPDEAPAVMINLGLLLEAQGRPEQAAAAYRQAIDTGHPEQAPPAMINLAVLLAKKGQAEQARTLLQQAIDTGHPDAAPMAMRALGLLKAVGQPEQTHTTFQQAVDTGHPEPR